MSIPTRLSAYFLLFFPFWAFAATGFKTGEQIGGLGKTCYYNVLGSTYTVTVSSIQLCPMTIEAPNPAPAYRLPVPANPGRAGFLRGEAIRGVNKLCYYDVLGSMAVLTVTAVSLCPITHSF